MLRQNAADVANRIHERVGEAFVPEMFAHKIDNALPITLAALFVNGLIANDGELMRARRDENQDAIAFARLVHPEPMKSLLPRNQRIAIQLPALKINANLG